MEEAVNRHIGRNPMIPRWYLPMMPSGKMCKNLVNFAACSGGSFVGPNADGPGDEVLEQEHRSVENVEWGSVESECDLAEDAHGDIQCPINEKRLVHATLNSSVCHAMAVYSPTTFNFPTVDGMLLKNGNDLFSASNKHELKRKALPTTRFVPTA